MAAKPMSDAEQQAAAQPVTSNRGGGQPGNQNASKAKVWSAAIMRALDRRVAANERIKAIDELADVFLAKCFEGDSWALGELGNRLEGKCHQTVGNAEGEVLRVEVTRYSPP